MMNKIKQLILVPVILISFSIHVRAQHEPWPLPSMGDYPFMPYIVKDPGPEYGEDTRMFQGLPSIVVTPGGRLWVTWYGGGESECQDNYILLATSGDDGHTWSAPKMVIDPPFRASEPLLWLDPNNRLWFMCNLYPLRSSISDLANYEEKYGNIDALKAFINDYFFVSTQLWVITTGNPDDENPQWSEPRLIAMEMRNSLKPAVLSDGSWVWPLTAFPKSTAHFSYPLYSNNEGETFFYQGKLPVPDDVRTFDEYQIVERRDGVLWLLTRTTYGIGESFSYNGGKTWSLVTPSNIRHTSSKFLFIRLASGNILLVKHGPIDKNVGRAQLMAFVSSDEGKSWQGGLMLDERNNVSYPEGMQAEDGRIYVVYDHNRYRDKEVLMTVFTEEDVMAGKAVSGDTRFKQMINKATLKNTRYDK